jgi:hypothetical protein
VIFSQRERAEHHFTTRIVENTAGRHHMQDFRWVHPVMAFLAATNFVVSLLNTVVLFMG